MFSVALAYLAGWLICLIAFSCASPIFSYEIVDGTRKPSWQRRAWDAAYFLLWPFLVLTLVVAAVAGAWVSQRARFEASDRRAETLGGMMQGRNLATAKPGPT